MTIYKTSAEQSGHTIEMVMKAKEIISMTPPNQKYVLG